MKRFSNTYIFLYVRVLKSGTAGDVAEENCVGAISGATLTSKGVDEMLGRVERAAFMASRVQ